MPIWSRILTRQPGMMPETTRLGGGFVEKGPLDRVLEVPRVSVGGDHAPEAFSPPSSCSPLHLSQPLEHGGHTSSLSSHPHPLPLSCSF